MPRWWYLFPALIAIASTLLAIWTVDRSQRAAEAAIHRANLPGEIDISLAKSGEFILFNEIHSWHDGRLVESGPQLGLMARLLKPSGEPLELEPLAGELAYDVNGAHGIALARFVIDSPGALQLQASYDDRADEEPVVLAIVDREAIPLMTTPWWPFPLAALFVFMSIVLAGMICQSRIRLLVDHESRAVPTMSSTTLPAPIWRRALATLIDFCALIALMMLLSPVLIPMFDVMTNAPSIWWRAGCLFAFLFLLLAYFMVPEALFGGTPGKFIMSLRTVTAEGRRLGYERSIVRNLLRAIDLMPFCYLAGAMTHLFSKNNRRIGDIAADTLVVIR